MSLIVFIVVFGLFALGLVLAFQGVVGKEVNPEQWLQLPADPDRPGITHPPEHHRLRLFLIGLVLMALAVGLGAVLA